MIIGSEGLEYGLGSIMTIHPHMVLTYTGIAEKPHGAELGGPKNFFRIFPFFGTWFFIWLFTSNGQCVTFSNNVKGIKCSRGSDDSLKNFFFWKMFIFCCALSIYVKMTLWSKKVWACSRFWKTLGVLINSSQEDNFKANSTVVLCHHPSPKFFSKIFWSHI